jgi:hypothetical protein
MVDYGYDPDIYQEGIEQIEDQQEDEEEDATERQQEIYEDVTPTYKAKDDLYSLFWKVIRMFDSSKTANLEKAELGMLDISVRDCQKIALLANSLGHPGFAKFFKAQGEIILATSSSRKGWLAELFVSQKRLKSREVKTPTLPEQPPRRKGIFRRR